MISVVIPVYNAAKYLPRTVASVQAQTRADWEIVLVDDGSKDSSAEVAAALCAGDARISLRRQTNAGAAAARNHGLRESNPSFPFALCLDSDDLLVPDALQTLLTLLEAHPDAPAACGFLRDIDGDEALLPDGSRLEPLTDRRGVEGRRLVRRAPESPVVFGDLCYRNHIITPGQVLIRKAALNAVGAFDESLVYVEDYDLWWRLTMQAGPIPVTPQVVLLYRHHAASISGNRAAVRRGVEAFRWRLLTHPDMTAAQKSTARLGYFYDCVSHFRFALHYLAQRDFRWGIKHLGLGARDTLRFFRHCVLARRYGAAHANKTA